jgi:hypothetical protein
MIKDVVIRQTNFKDVMAKRFVTILQAIIRNKMTDEIASNFVKIWSDQFHEKEKLRKIDA